ncbi:DUF2252 domain-containing protein [Homoserinimonas sp. OAct 916]|uniref:DUF2252 domain-containing protein n=1 Tax=Homoserinimonas sp. OAct 916 TaxID=2211450 RepID=UPI000DBE5A5A|nr:DUF2252 domain-containing protein [Homoserinimonas sp. OAct 916]
MAIEIHHGSDLWPIEVTTRDQLKSDGRALRKQVSRPTFARYVAHDRDPLAILQEQNERRVQSLIPLRMGRMLVSPFTFYRGSAAIMAADLAHAPTTGIEIVACGDAHLSNFGFFASPERDLVFDLNDFDEASLAPWEWDLKRLVTSVVIGSRESGLDEATTVDAALQTATAYRLKLRELVSLSVLDRYYHRLMLGSASGDLSPRARKVVAKAERQAHRRTSAAFVRKVTRVNSAGVRELIEDPPVLTHVPEMAEERLTALFERYRSTVPADIALLLSQFTLTDLAMRVVGVGSVGTRCYILLLTGPNNEPLVLQVKEAQPSVLRVYGHHEPVQPDERIHEGHRVVANQRILQAVSDPFLGHLQVAGRDFYVRQFRDMKSSIDTSRLTAAEYGRYGQACARLLARGHVQSSNSPMIAGYLGTSPSFDSAMVEWALAYADQSLADYRILKAAVDSGEIEALAVP